MSARCNLFLTALIALISLRANASPDTATPPMPTLPETCYLFSSFRGNGTDGLHLAWSTDGYTWRALRDDRSFLKPEVGSEKLMRDPCIVQGPDGVFHMVWTDSWNDRTIGYASSRDLLTWSAQRALPVMEHEPNARNCWAPEIVYDDENARFLIFWSTTITGRFPETDHTAENNYNHRIYATTTTDFVTFTPTRLFYDPGFNCIDATILRDTSSGRFHLFIKDETRDPVVKKHLRVAESPHLEGPYTKLSEPFTGSWVEGPAAVKIGDEYLVYYDCYTRHCYEAMRSKDLRTWEDVSHLVTMPKGTRHGSVLPVHRDVLQRLLEAEPTDK